MKEIYLFKRLSNIGRRLLCTHQGNVCVAIAQALEAAKPLWGQHLALLFPYNQGVICNPSLCAGLWHHVLAQIFAIGGVKKYQIKRRAGAGRQLQQIPWPKGDLDVWIKQSFIFADQFCRFTSVIDQPQTLCAARKGLKPQSTGSGEKVKNLRVLQRISKPPRGKHVE